MPAPSYTYGLYPFAWDAAAKCHAPPVGSACVLDFRPLAEQAKQSQSSGYGLFAWASSPPGDLVAIGTGYAPTLAIDTAARNELRIKLGLSASPSGATLADAIADVLGALADPTGAGGPKPLTPTSSGQLELHLEGHSRIWSQAVDINDLLSANPSPRINRLRDVIRADMDTAEQHGGAKKVNQVLGALLLSLGVSRDEVKQGASGKAAGVARLMNAALKAKHGAKLKPEDPQTSYAEAWPNVAADITAIPQSQSWASLQYTLSVTSGQAGFAHAAGATFAIHAVRCTSAVSSANHWATLAVYAFGQPGYFGPMARVATGAFTGYSHIVTFSGSRYLSKWVAGTRTDLANAAAGSWSDGDLPKCYPNGSSIGGTWPGKSDLTATDTAITGNLSGGIVYQDDTNQHQHNKVGAWALDDGLNPPVAAFSGTPLSGVAPLNVAFSDASTNTPTSWLWERTSDGSLWSTFSTSQNPTASFAAGTWGVRLTAANAGGSNTLTRLLYVTALAGGARNVLLLGAG